MGKILFELSSSMNNIVSAMHLILNISNLLFKSALVLGVLTTICSSAMMLKKDARNATEIDVAKITFYTGIFCCIGAIFALLTI